MSCTSAGTKSPAAMASPAVCSQHAGGADCTSGGSGCVASPASWRSTATLLRHAGSSAPCG
eukprot:scaffold11834_cov92-Isochrysis_galbana.AAC.1